MAGDRDIRKGFLKGVDSILADMKIDDPLSAQIIVIDGRRDFINVCHHIYMNEDMLVFKDSRKQTKYQKLTDVLKSFFS